MAKILIVDDSEVIRLDLKETLEGAGHQVVEGDNGNTGLESAKSNPDVDLVITDLNMPEMDGLTMCKELKKLDAYASTPIFVLTTESSPELKAEGKQNGVVLWIVKPFKPEKVTMAIDKILSRGAA